MRVRRAVARRFRAPPVSQGSADGRLFSRRGSGRRAVGGRPWPAGRLGLRYVTGRAGALSAARRRAPRPRRAGGAAAQPTPRAAAGAAAPARDVRGANRARARARGARRDRGRRTRCGRARGAAQHLARVDLARPAHAAGGHGGRRFTLAARGATLDDATRTQLASRSRRKRATCRSSYRRCSI